MTHEVIVFDPVSSLCEGTLVLQDGNLGTLRRRGVVSIPVDASLRWGALSPFSKTYQGAGILLHPDMSKVVGHGALWLFRNCGFVSWAAMLLFHPSVSPKGRIRLVGEPGPEGIAQAPVSGRNDTDVGASLDTERISSGYTIVEGMVPCQTARAGLFGFALAGYCRGLGVPLSKNDKVRLAWLALGQV